MVTVEATDTLDTVNGILYGLSTDEKPLGGTFEGKIVPNGAKFFEMDTKEVAFYDAENDQWL